MSDLETGSRSITKMRSEEVLDLITSIRRERRNIMEATAAKRAASREEKPSLRKPPKAIKDLSLEQIQDLLAKLEEPK